MARTQAADYDQRRLAIVEAAAALYAERGFLGASLVEVAQACKASKSLIYHYYASKEDILYDVMASHIQTLNLAADAVERTQDPPEVKLRKLTHAFMGRYVGAAARHKVLLNELGHLPPDRRAQIVDRQRRLIQVVEGLLRKIQPKLRSRRKFARPAAMLYFGMINWTHTWFDPNGQATPDEVADMVVDVMTGGLPNI